ncbi:MULTISPECIES: MarR family winged helix-turn-helix transcriptional regulator [unclassified Pseudofrankia]|uniref:MarR family winged helix-turn-helix transcriptional regulator n=1 Tax=unclassified Pseudofrankia TaxID=2994372 RepID=UPI0009F31A16|nr:MULTISPECIES: MarR family transcriptional regulator [unclassified Pseudofrankia]MDT3441923.1 MarR family transcriptional regulator [Pseudofrankia sp. BMG5.37]
MAALRRLGRAWTAVADELLAEEGATLAQYAVLTALSQDTPLSGAELARRCGVTAATMSALLANLDNRGLLARAKDPSGGRAVLTRLTPAGTALLERCDPHIDAIERQFLAEVSESELRGVEDVLLRWARRFEELQQPARLSDTIARTPRGTSGHSTSLSGPAGPRRGALSRPPGTGPDGHPSARLPPG